MKYKCEICKKSYNNILYHLYQILHEEGRELEDESLNYQYYTYISKIIDDQDKKKERIIITNNTGNNSYNNTKVEALLVMKKYGSNIDNNSKIGVILVTNLCIKIQIMMQKIKNNQ